MGIKTLVGLMLLLFFLATPVMALGITKVEIPSAIPFQDKVEVIITVDPDNRRGGVI